MTEIDIPAAMEKAADYITEKPEHFGKGRFKVAEGCFCTLGAFALALGVSYENDFMNFGDVDSGEWDRRSNAFDEGWEKLNETTGGQAVQTMNDRPETTADQMAGVLRETAARLRAEAA